MTYQMNPDTTMKRRKAIRKRRIRRNIKRIFLLVAAVLLFAAAVSFVKGLFPNQGIDGLVQEVMKSLGTDDVEQFRHDTDKYPERLVEALEHNEELLEFTKGYPEKIGTYDSSITVKEDEKRGIPLFMQWDERWGYAQYGTGCIGLDGCGPTCLSVVYVGLTGDTSMHPKAMADFSINNGYVTEDSGTKWALMTDGAESLGLTAQEIPLGEQQMANELKSGHPIICSVRPGDFTTTGHFIVIYKYKDGLFYVNDPNSRKRSEKGYDFERLSVQIKAIWSYEY